VVEKDKEGDDVFVSWKEQVQNMSRDEFEAFLKAKADEILDKVAKTVIEELADKVMGEADEAVQEVERLAEGEVARRNLELSEGISSSAPLFTVNRDLALNCLQRLGFNLGDSSVEKNNNLNDLLGVGIGG
jgi:hypothetical protein